MSAKMLTKSGQTVHPIGIGTWGYGKYPTFSPGASAEVNAIKYSLSLGQNHIDTAEMYANGGAEQIVGEAIKYLNRQGIFIATKLWKNHVGGGTVRTAVEAMLQRLNTDYIDLLYIHAPWFDAPWQEAIGQINQLMDEGVVRYFGVSNFPIDKLKIAVTQSKHSVSANQIHYSYFHRSEATPELRAFCKVKNIQLVAYTPLERGAMGHDPKLQKIADDRHISIAQVALAWLLKNKVWPIPKAVRKTHINQNLLSAQISLTDQEMAILNYI